MIQSSAMQPGAVRLACRLGGDLPLFSLFDLNGGIKVAVLSVRAGLIGLPLFLPRPIGGRKS